MGFNRQCRYHTSSALMIFGKSGLLVCWYNAIMSEASVPTTPHGMAAVDAVVVFVAVAVAVVAVAPDKIMRMRRCTLPSV